FSAIRCLLDLLLDSGPAVPDAFLSISGTGLQADYVRSIGFALFLQLIGNLLKVLNEAPHLSMAGCRIGGTKYRRRVHGSHDMRDEGTLYKSSPVPVHTELSSQERLCGSCAQANHTPGPTTANSASSQGLHASISEARGLLWIRRLPRAAPSRRTCFTTLVTSTSDRSMPASASASSGVRP